MGFDGAILDVDGVLTHTAAQHERAWAEMLGPVLAQHGDDRPFSHDDYLAHVHGRPRLAGLRDLLAARGIALPAAEADALAEQKDRGFLDLIDREGVEVFEDAVRQVRSWRARGLGVAFVSASRNAARVLAAAGIADLCDVRVDGETARSLGLGGKADLFREAIRQLAVEPPRALVVEDAVAGAAAAAEIGVGLVVGVARGRDGADLLAAGADRVVARLDELDDLTEPGTRRASELPRALPFDAVAARLDGRRPALLIDFDGTLAPIVPHPDDAALDPATRDALRGLATRCRIAIVSGRERTDVERRVAIDGLWYAGSHGFDIRGPAGETFTPPAAGGPALDELDQAESRLRRELGELPGIVIERKRFGLTAHYRLSPGPVAERALQLVRSIARESPHLAAHPGERVIELRPDVRWDKGRAVDHLLEVWRPGDAVLPIYLGDGLTDEDAFGALADRGLLILVGAPLRPTRAHLRLADPAEVGVFLAELRAWLDQADGRAAWTLRLDG